MKWSNALALGFSCALFAPLARADDDAQSLLARGIERRTQRRDAEALDLFRQAYALEPSLRARAQIGLAEQATGDWIAAETDLNAVVDAPSDPWVARNLPAIQTALDGVRSHLASISVSTNAPNATLWVDGVKRGNLPLESPARTPIGDVTLTVRAEGYEPFEERVALTPGAVLQQQVSLRTAASPPEPAAPPVPDSPAERPFEPVHSPAPTEPPPHASTRALSWGMLATGGVLAGGAVTAQVLAINNASIYNDDRRCLVGNLSRDEQCGSYKASAQSFYGVALVGYGFAAASVATGLVLMLKSAPPGPAHADRSGCGPSIGSWGVSCQGHF
jgi:hypothetical protein